MDAFVVPLWSGEMASFTVNRIFFVHFSSYLVSLFPASIFPMHRELTRNCESATTGVVKIYRPRVLLFHRRA